MVGFAKPAGSTGQVDALFYRNSTYTIYQLAMPTGLGYDGHTCDCIANGISPNGTYVVGSITYYRYHWHPAGIAQTDAAVLDLQLRWRGDYDLDGE